MVYLKTRDIFSFAGYCIAVILFFQNILVLNGQAHRQSEPININWLTSTPWDVANSLRTPLGGPLALVLAAFLASIMMFGLLIAPVQYLFGDPIRTYHPHDPVMEPPEIVIGRSFNFEEEPFQFSGFQNYTDKKSETSESTEYPLDFHNSIFYFIPEKDVNCKNLIICHAHGFLSLIPSQFLKFYHFVSKKIPEMPLQDKNAILTGLQDQGQCTKTYGNCSRNIITIARDTFNHVVPRNVNFNLYTLLSYLD